MRPALTHGHLEKSAIERIRSQAGADAGMSLICSDPLELEFFEVPTCWTQREYTSKHSRKHWIVKKDNAIRSQRSRHSRCVAAGA